MYRKNKNLLMSERNNRKSVGLWENIFQIFGLIRIFKVLQSRGIAYFYNQKLLLTLKKIIVSLNQL